VQNISAAFGGILSKMAGGGRHTTGAYLSRMGNALGGANGFYLYYEDNIPNDVKKYLSDTATKLILERTTIKSLEYLGNEVIQEYPYLADEVKQKLGGIKFVKQVDGGYGTLVGAVIVYVALLDYKYESNPKITKELEDRIKGCITD